MPQCQMGGMVWGSKLCSFKKYMVFTDYENKLKGVILFGYSKNQSGKVVKSNVNMVYGKIYKFNPDKSMKKEDDIIKMADLEEEYYEIQGDYMEYLNIGGEDIWNNQRDSPSLVTPHPNPLPSDWRFREDLIWLNYNE